MVLGDFIDHYEPLFYDHHHLKDQHHRATRSPMDHFFFHFTAHKRHFRLRLKRDTTVFAPDIVFESTDKTVHYDTSRAVKGYVEDIEDSSAEGVVTTSGLLDGVVRIGEEEFYIEPAEKYLSSPQQFHSVIYKLSDVRFPQDNFTCLSHLIQHPIIHTPLDGKKYRHAKTRWRRLQTKLKSRRPHRKENFIQNTNPGVKTFSEIRSNIQQLRTFSKKPFSSKESSLSGVGSNRLFKSVVDFAEHREAMTSTEHLNGRANKQDASASIQRTRETADARFVSFDWEDATADSTHIENVLVGTTYSYSFNYLNRYFKTEVFKEKSLKRTKSKIPGSVLNKGESHTSFGVHGLVNSSNTVNSVLREHSYRSLAKNSEGVSGSIPAALPNGRENDTAVNVRTLNTSVARNSTKNKKKERSGVFSPLEKSAGSADAAENIPISDNAGKNRAPPYWRELDALHYTEDGRTGSSEPYGVRSIQRTQWNEDRGQRHVAVDRRKSTCLLYLQADHLFYQRMGSEEACIEAMTRHVQKVNSIYRTADFDQDGRPDNISFLIKRIKVHTRPDDSEYRFVGNYGVEKFLELFSEDDYDAFCLAYMFTYRDFEGGTLGLAWTGDLKNAGGVCEKNGHYRGSLKSLNTGIITLLNYGKHVPPVVSHVTLAHEIGHNFGSPHDPEEDLHCTPGGDYGNYIMFARATSGDKKNNNKFSPCSLRSINAVLNTKARSVKGCFTEPLDAVCGNEVVEGAEECDCGWEEDCHEPCCFPMRVSPPQDQPPCRLKPVAYCSPSQGPCCSHDCRLKFETLCREDNGCRTSSYCDGQRAQCPSSTKKPNKTICSEEFVCYNGECTGSICMAYGLESCQCVRHYHDPLIRSCELCCKLPGDESSCKSSFEWNLAPYDVPDLYAKPGAPCDNYNGYCDVYQTCREIDPSGPLATLRKILMSPEGAAILRRWFAERWWGILLLLLAVVITVAILVRLLSRRNAKNFLSTILPGQNDFHFCHSKPSPRPRSSCLVTSASGTSNSLVKSSLANRPRISSAPENGWV